MEENGNLNQEKKAIDWMAANKVGCYHTIAHGIGIKPNSVSSILTTLVRRQILFTTFKKSHCTESKVAHTVYSFNKDRTIVDNNLQARNENQIKNVEKEIPKTKKKNSKEEMEADIFSYIATLELHNKLLMAENKILKEELEKIYDM